MRLRHDQADVDQDQQRDAQQDAVDDERHHRVPFVSKIPQEPAHDDVGEHARHGRREQVGRPPSRRPGATWCRTFASLYRPASVIAGMESRNEKRAASSRVSPRNRPVVMVQPERDAPGTTASACASHDPERVAERHLLQRHRLPRPALGDQQDQSARMISAAAMKYRLRYSLSIFFSSASPAMISGTVPKTMYQPSRASVVPGGNSIALPEGCARARRRSGPSPAGNRR